MYLFYLTLLIKRIVFVQVVSFWDYYGKFFGGLAWACPKCPPLLFSIEFYLHLKKAVQIMIKDSVEAFFIILF